MPSQQPRTLRVRTKNGEVFHTRTWATGAVDRLADDTEVVEIALIDMTDEQYNSIPAAGKSQEFFQRKRVLQPA